MLSSNNQHHTRSFTNMINNPTAENTETYNRKLKIQLKNVMYPIFRKICLERDDIVSLINECKVSDANFKSSILSLTCIITADCKEREEIFDEWRKQCEELIPNYAYPDYKIEWDSIFNWITPMKYYNACFMMFFLEIAKENLAMARRTVFAREEFNTIFKIKMNEMENSYSDMNQWKGTKHYFKLFYT
jgi:hypothetical protein